MLAKKYIPVFLAAVAFFLLFVTREHATNKKESAKGSMQDMPEDDEEDTSLEDLMAEADIPKKK
jgi:hypothetical protein